MCETLGPRIESSAYLSPELQETQHSEALVGAACLTCAQTKETESFHF